MTSTKLGLRIMQLGMILWIIQNFIFGWNLHPQSDAEKTADLYCNIILKLGIFLYLLPLIKLYEYSLKKMNDEK
jgi:hypothetical protein